MYHLNYNHLRYFHAIVDEGTLTAAAERLNIAQSAVSIQLKQLEENLGCALFDREHKSLILTEEGRMVYDYAQTIFKTANEMLASLQTKNQRYQNVLRVGSVATLSRNFQSKFLRSAIIDDEVEVVIQSASMGELLSLLQSHQLDLVLSNNAVQKGAGQAFESHLIAEQAVSLVGPRSMKKRRRFRFPDDLKQVPLVLPSYEHDIRRYFDRLMENSNIKPLIAAEADDMAMLRLLARDMDALSVLPPVVVQDEMEAKILVEIYKLPQVYERFYAITGKRRFANPYLKALLEQIKK